MPIKKNGPGCCSCNNAPADDPSKCPCTELGKGIDPGPLQLTVVGSNDPRSPWYSATLRIYRTGPDVPYPFSFGHSDTPFYIWWATPNMAIACSNCGDPPPVDVGAGRCADTGGTFLGQAVSTDGQWEATFQTIRCSPLYATGRSYGDGGTYTDLILGSAPPGGSGNTDAPAQTQPAMAPFRGDALAPAPTLRIGLVCPWLLQGGAEAWQATLARGLGDLLGPLVSFEGAACINEPAEPAMLAELSALMPVEFGWEAARDLAGRCDVIVTWHVADFAALYEGLPTPPKTLFACHLPTKWGSGTEALLSSVDRLVAVSPSAQKPIAPSLLPRSVVIENAVDASRMTTARSRAAVRASWEVPADAKVIGFLGRLSPEKDPDAAVRLAEEWPEGHVVVIGDGPLRTALTLGAPPNLHLVGADHDKSVLPAMDALMVPSLYESFGLSIAEGNWMGVPVLSPAVGIAAQTPSLSRTVPIGAGGEEWAAAVRADFADTAGTAQRVAAAKKFVRERYTLDRFSRSYASVLADLAPAIVGDQIRSLLLPSVAQMAGTLAKAAFHQAMAGNPEASPAEQGKRLAACQACPLWDRSADRCSECGCQLRIKRRWATSRCPLGNWEAESSSIAA